MTDRYDLLLAGVTHSQAAVLAGGAEETAVVVPAHAVEEVRVVVHGDQGLTRTHVPDDDQVITACGWKGGGTMEEEERGGASGCGSC